MGSVLAPRQVRQLIILGFALAVLLSILFLAPRLLDLMRKFHQAAEAPPPAPAVDQAPPPPASPLVPGAVILDGALQEVKDATPLHDVYKEPAYLKMIRNVSMVKEEELRSRAEGNVAYATFLKYAPELRGRIFHLMGESMQEVMPVRLADPVDGREDVYRVYMWDEGIEAGFVIDLVDRPRETLQERDPIELEGMFYKIVRYKPQKGADRDVPLFVARSFRRLPREAQSQKTSSQFIFEVVLVIGIVAVLAAAYLITRKMAGPRTPRTPAAFNRPPPSGPPGPA